MQFRSRLLSVYVGPDFCRVLDFHIFVGFGPVRCLPRCVLCTWPAWLSLSWNWRPRLRWRWNSPPPFQTAGWSPAWTGRYRELVGWSWPIACSFGWH